MATDESPTTNKNNGVNNNNNNNNNNTSNNTSNNNNNNILNVEAKPSGLLNACAPKTFSVLSHNKMALHALKYTSKAVLGVLIGYRKSSERLSHVHIMDAIPLIHNTFSAMVVELAFSQINTWLADISKRHKLTEKLQIIGAYFANEHNADSRKLTGAVVICEQLIKEYGENTVVLAQIDNERIIESYKNKDTCVEFYMLRNGGSIGTDKDWKKTDIFLTTNALHGKWAKSSSSNESMKLYEEYLTKFDSKQSLANHGDLNFKPLVDAHQEEYLCDFEDHLDNISKDWRNIHCC